MIYAGYNPNMYSPSMASMRTVTLPNSPYQWTQYGGTGNGQAQQQPVRIGGIGAAQPYLPGGSMYEMWKQRRESYQQPIGAVRPYLPGGSMYEMWKKRREGYSRPLPAIEAYLHNSTQPIYQPPGIYSGFSPAYSPMMRG